MPLREGKGTVRRNMHDLKHGPHHRKMAAKYGEAKAHEIDTAIALKKSRERPSIRRAKR